MKPPTTNAALLGTLLLWAVASVNTAAFLPVIAVDCSVMQDASGKTTADGQASVNLTGAPPISYEVNNSGGELIAQGVITNFSSVTLSLNELLPGTYYVQAEDNLANVFECSFIIGYPDCELMVMAEDVNVVCAADTASLETFVSGGIPPYQIEWSTGSDQTVVHGLAAGTYGLTVTDDSGCEVITTASVIAPEPIILNCSELIPATNTGSGDGQVSLAISGGQEPYSFTIRDYRGGVFFNTSTSNSPLNIGGLAGGRYSVELIDDNGCASNCEFTISLADCSLAVILENDTVSCYNDPGVLSAFPSGGVPPLSFEWNNGDSTIAISGLPAGDYDLTVTDGANCQVTASARVVAPFPLSITATNIQPATSNNTEDGTLLLNFNGGNPPYTSFSLTKNSTGELILQGMPPANTFPVSGLPPGSYTLRLIDQTQCDTMIVTTVGVVNCDLGAVVSYQPLLCNTDSTDVTVQPEGGLPPFSFHWSDGLTAATHPDLSEGTYTVTLTDDAGCVFVVMPEVTGPPELETFCNIQQNVSTPAGMDGRVSLSINGGTPGYDYQLIKDQSEEIIAGTMAGAPFNLLLDNLRTGQYLFAVTDANGCQDTCSVEITGPPCTLALGLTNIQVNCPEDQWVLKAAVTGGTPHFLYRWSNNTFEDSISALPGHYSVTVTDATGCVVVGSVTISSRSDPQIAFSGFVAASSESIANGGVTIRVDSLQLPYTLNIYDEGGLFRSLPGLNSTAIIFDDLPAGEYRAEVVDGRSCLEEAPFTISLYIPSLSEWGLVILAFILLTLGVVVLEQRILQREGT